MRLVILVAPRGRRSGCERPALLLGRAGVARARTGARFRFRGGGGGGGGCRRRGLAAAAAARGEERVHDRLVFTVGVLLASSLLRARGSTVERGRRRFHRRVRSPSWCLHLRRLGRGRCRGRGERVVVRRVEVLNRSGGAGDCSARLPCLHIDRHALRCASDARRTRWLLQNDGVRSEPISREGLVKSAEIGKSALSNAVLIRNSNDQQ